MRNITEKQADSKVLVFEPGNATRYYLTLTQTSEYNMVMVDMNNHKVVEFSPKFLNARDLSFLLESKGYSSGDAVPMAHRLVKAVRETAYITHRPYDGGSVTWWFEDTEQDWEEQLVGIGEEGGSIIERGVLNWELEK